MRPRTQGAKGRGGVPHPPISDFSCGSRLGNKAHPGLIEYLCGAPNSKHYSSFLDVFFSNPPKPYNFVGRELADPKDRGDPNSPLYWGGPLQSKIFNWRNVMKHITWANLLTGITIFFIFYIIRTYIISCEWFLVEIRLLEDIVVNLKIYRDILLGSMAVFSRLLVLGFWQEIFDLFSDEKMHIGSPSVNNTLSSVRKDESLPSNLTYNAMDKGESAEKGSNNPSGNSSTKYGATATREVNPDPIVVSILADSIQEDTLQLNKSILALAEALKKYNELSFDKIKLTSEAEEPLLTLLRKQSTLFTTHIRNRTTWVESRTVNAIMGNQFKVKEIHSDLVEIQQKYLDKVKKISQLENKTLQLKEFYATLNEYRNSIVKELNKAENIILEDIRKSPLYKYPHLRKELNVGFVQAKKEFNDQDSYLKKKVGEIIQNKK